MPSEQREVIRAITDEDTRRYLEDYKRKKAENEARSQAQRAEKATQVERVEAAVLKAQEEVMKKERAAAAAQVRD